MDGRHDPPCSSSSGRMSLLQQVRYAAVTVEAEAEPKLHGPVRGVMAAGRLMNADTWL